MHLPVLHLAQPRAPPRNHHGRRPPATTKPSLAELALKMEPAHSNEAPLPLNFISNRCNEKRPNWLLSSLAPAAAYLPFYHRPLPLSLSPAAHACALPLNRARALPRASCAVPAAAGELLAPPLPVCAAAFALMPSRCWERCYCRREAILNLPLKNANHCWGQSKRMFGY